MAEIQKVYVGANEIQKVYVGAKSPYMYIGYGTALLSESGQCIVAARGRSIEKAIIISHLLAITNIGVHIVDERTHVEQLPNDRRYNSPELPSKEGELRDVAVYEARLIRQVEDSEFLKTGTVQSTKETEQ